MSKRAQPEMRVDAKRNRERILAAARAAFAEPEADVSMAEVARRSGVGMATLYRNFPGRRELLEALFADEIDALCQVEDVIGQPPGAGLIDWLGRFFAFARRKRQFASELLQYTDAHDPVFETSRARVLAAGRPLLATAQAAGVIRPDIDLEHVLDMVIAVATARTDDVEPIFRTAVDGLRFTQA